MVRSHGRGGGVWFFEFCGDGTVGGAQHGERVRAVVRDPNHGGSRRLRRLRICLFSIASSRFFPFIARVIRLRVRGKLVNEHVSSAISLTLSRDERAAMNFDPLSKRDEAVALVREGSVVFGASRYDSSLRCIRRRTRRLRRRTLHLSSYCTQSRIRSTRGRPTLAANVGVSEAHPFCSDVERVRLPCVAAAVVRRL